MELKDRPCNVGPMDMKYEEDYFITINKTTGKMKVLKGDPSLLCNKDCNKCKRIYCG